MKQKQRVRLAIILTLTAVLQVLLAAVFAYLGRSAPLPADWGPWYGNLITLLGPFFGLILGGVLIAKVPGNVYGWVWLALGLGIAMQVLGQYYAIYALMVAPNPLQLGWTAAGIAGYGWLLGVGMAPLVLLLFPTGRPPTPRWRIVVWLVIAALVAGLCTSWTIGTEGMVPLDNPYEPGGAWVGWLRSVANLAVIALFLAIALSAVSMLHRYQLAIQAERQQLKWFASGTLVFVLILGSDFLYTAPGVWEPLKEALFFSILPLAIGVAILRYRLWDIDIIIRKTLQYTAVTALLSIIYFGSVFLLQRLFSNVSGQQSPLILVASTLLIAALFAPLRRRIQDGIDRRFYRQRYDARQVVAQFARTARDETDMNALLAELERTIQDTLQPEGVRVWLKPTPSHRTGIDAEWPSSQR